MLYISAQPAELYFLWQIKLQLKNFKDIGIKPNNIHVLFGFIEYEKIPQEIIDFIQIDTSAKFYLYRDVRDNPKYLSSIRPHILKHHFRKNKNLSSRVLFYHDSDIFLREPLDEITLKKTSKWYFSDAKSYTSSEYLKKFGNKFFKKLCEFVDINPSKVESNDSNSGGAQYVIKNIDYTFWQDVEKDCEKIFKYINWFNTTNFFHDNNYPEAWCADMWAVLWNSWKRNIEVRLHPELDFCWPMDDLKYYYQTKILHYAGVFKESRNDLFCKQLYQYEPPFHVDFSNLSQTKCSKIIVDIINDYSRETPGRILENTKLIITIFDKDILSYDFINHYLRYIHKHFNVSITVLEIDRERSNNIVPLYNNVEHLYINKNTYFKFVNSIEEDNVIFVNYNLWLTYDAINYIVSMLSNESTQIVFSPQNYVAMSKDEYEAFTEMLIFPNKELYFTLKNTYNISGINKKGIKFKRSNDSVFLKKYKSMGKCLLTNKPLYKFIQDD